jgi:hypothetical protein
MGYEKYVRISRNQVKTWMEQVVAGIDNEQTQYQLAEPGTPWMVWGLAQAANAHFDFSPGDAEVNMRTRVLQNDVSQDTFRFSLRKLF